MDDLTVLVTGCGAPGTAGTLYCLRNNPDSRSVRVVGTDMNYEAYGRYLCDSFHKIPPAITKDYIGALLDVCKQEHVRVVLPQNTAELEPLARHLGHFQEARISVCVSSPEAILQANNKKRLLSTAKRIGVPVPAWATAQSMDELVLAAKNLGWPAQQIVIKPPASNGMRGVRIVDESYDLKCAFYESKPGDIRTTMATLKRTIGSDFPELMVMEYLPGAEYTVDVLLGSQRVAVPRRRVAMLGGITSHAIVERNTQIEEYALRLSHELGLAYAHGYQFRCDGHGIPRLLESNPRIQGTMVVSALAGANLVYGAIKQALGEPLPPFTVSSGASFVRYWGGVGLVADGRRVTI